MKGERHVEALDRNGDGTADASGSAERDMARQGEPIETRPEALVEVNYPDPTPLGVIVRDVAKWSGQSFVMEPSVNAKLQIFAPRKQTKAQAWELFLASLSVVGLRAVQVGRVVKIVASGLPISA